MNQLQKHISQDIINVHRYNSIKNVGKLNELIYSCNPENLNEWINYYYNYIKETGKNKLLIGIIDKILIDYSYLKREDIQECFRKRIFIDTFNGYIREKQAKLLIEKETNLVLIKSDDELDRLYSVDYLVNNKNGDTLFGLQIKPESYFKSNHHQVLKDKKNNINKNLNFKNKYNILCLEISVEDGKIIHNRDKLFKLVEQFY